VPFLEETLKSLLTQTFEDFELIISDNASTDGTPDICRTYAARDHRIQYHRNDANIGANRNYNRVFQLSRGEYFRWVAADDLCEPELLARCVEALDRDQGTVLAYARAKFIDVSGNFLEAQDPGWHLHSDAAHERLRYVIFSGHWANALFGLMRAKALAKTRLLPSYPGGDYRLLGELSLMGKFHEIPAYLFFRRLHAGATTGNSSNLSWLMEYYKAGAGRIYLPTWNLGFDHLTTIIRSGLTLRHKFFLLRCLFRCMRWSRGHLIEELKLALGRHPSRCSGARS
jgi:glycosyltransferase involved in cell wall biosynthesis